MAETVITPAETWTLREALQTKLLTKCSKVYYLKAKGVEGGPYIVFSLGPGFYEENDVQYEMEVNILGFGTDTLEVENLTDSVWDMFNHYYEHGGSLSYVVYPASRNELDEEEKNNIHRRLTFTVKRFIGGY